MLLELSGCLWHPEYWPTEPEWLWVGRPGMYSSALLILSAPFVRSQNGLKQCVQEYSAETLQVSQSTRIELPPYQGGGGVNNLTHWHH